MKFTKREMSSSDGSKDDYLRLKDGESKIGVLRGEIYEFYNIWAAGKSQVVPADHPLAKARFKANFFIREGEQLVPKIWEFGPLIYNQLADIASEYEITETPIKVTRTGSTKDNTKYSVMPILKTPLTPKQLKQLESAELHILGGAKAEPQGEYPPAWDKDDTGPELEF